MQSGINSALTSSVTVPVTINGVWDLNNKNQTIANSTGLTTVNGVVLFGMNSVATTNTLTLGIVTTGAANTNYATTIAGVGTLTKVGNSTSVPVITGNSFYWGQTGFSVNTKNEAQLGAINALPITTVLQLGTGSTGTNTIVQLDLKGSSQIVGGLMTSSTFGLTATTAADQWSITASTAATLTFAGALAYNGTSTTTYGNTGLGGAAALGTNNIISAVTLNVASGTLILANTNTYTGGTNINGGTLVLSAGQTAAATGISAFGSIGNTNAGTLAINGGTFQLNTVATAVTGASGSSPMLSGALTLGGGATIFVNQTATNAASVINL